MKSNAAESVAAFVAHTSEQERQRQEHKSRGEHYAPSFDDKARREALMHSLLDGLELSKAELLQRLSIDRATWDRWRHMTSIPQRAQLDALSRFVTQRADDASDEITLPRAFQVLGTPPYTWGRLRLVFGLFKWNDAVFSFRTPFNDTGMATEMALLALKGCRLIYFMSDAANWRLTFADNLTKVLGKNDTARALSRVCIVQISNKASSSLPEFGVFNLESEDPDKFVGYVWKDTRPLDEQSRFKQPEDEDDDLYEAFPATADLISDLREQYSEELNTAFNELDKRKRDLPDLWAAQMGHSLRKELLLIPIIYPKAGDLTLEKEI